MRTRTRGHRVPRMTFDNARRMSDSSIVAIPCNNGLSIYTDATSTIGVEGSLSEPHWSSHCLKQFYVGDDCALPLKYTKYDRNCEVIKIKTANQNTDSIIILWKVPSKISRKMFVW